MLKFAHAGIIEFQALRDNGMSQSYTDASTSLHNARATIRCPTVLSRKLADKPAVFKQTNNGEDIVKAKGFMWCLPIVNETYIRNGNSNRFQGISSLEMDRGGSIQAEEEVVEFLSTTFRKNLNAPAYAMKVC